MDTAFVVDGFLFLQPMCLCDVRDAEFSADWWAISAIGQHAVQLCGSLTLFIRGGVEHGKPDGSKIAYVERAEWKFRSRVSPGHKDNSSAHSQQRDAAVQCGHPQGFKPQVNGSGLADDFRQPLIEVFFAIQHHMICAGLSTELGFLRGTGGGDDGGTRGFGQLDNG